MSDQQQTQEKEVQMEVPSQYQVEWLEQFRRQNNLLERISCALEGLERQVIQGLQLRSSIKSIDEPAQEP
jgi:hypothetical protein